MASREVFELSIEIQPDDIDALGHVNNTIYLRWVQDAATAHWRELAPREAQEDVVWVVLRHEIDYKHPAVPGDVVIARTWVGEARGLTFERHTEIVRKPDDRLLAQARTTWCPVDRATGRPRRVNDDVRERFSATGDADGPAS